MIKIYKNYVGGKWISSNSGETFTSVSPANNKKVLGKFQASNKHDVNKAVEAAEKASKEYQTEN